MPSLLRAYTAVLALLVLIHVRSTAAQNCYYPNGDVAQGDAACSSDGGACCPYQWECLSNGLCYLDNAGYYGRYTCTDQTWQSSSCPEICTESNTASGNEAVLQCSDGSWCCDGDRSFNCCTTANTDYFALPQGNSIAFISSVPSATSVASLTSSNTAASTSDATPTIASSQASSSYTSDETTASQSSSATAAQSQTTSSTLSTAPSSSSQPQSTTTQAAASTYTSASLTTASNGAISTISIVSVVTIAPASISTNPSSSSPPSKKSSHLGLIIGLAVGIPFLLLATALLALLIRKRRKHNRLSYLSPPRPSSSDDPAPTITDKYGHQVGHLAPDGRAPELDSHPVALGRSQSGRKSELEGSNGLLLHSSPAVSSTTGTTGSSPPKYSQHSPLSPGLNSVQEEPQQEPQELWGGYVPYRPPRTELPTGA